jgi:hypothetical protein
MNRLSSFQSNYSFLLLGARSPLPTIQLSIANNNDSVTILTKSQSEKLRQIVNCRLQRLFFATDLKLTGSPSEALSPATCDVGELSCFPQHCLLIVASKGLLAG